MTHEMYLKKQAEVEAQRTSTGNQRLFILWKQNSTQEIKCDSSRIQVVMSSRNSGKVSGAINWALSIYEPINALEYE